MMRDDLAIDERGHRERHREVGLARAGRTDPERHRGAPDRVDVALLVERLRRDLLAAMTPDDVVQHVGAGDAGIEHATERLDRLRADREPLLDECTELLDHDRGAAEPIVGSLDEHLVAAQVHRTAEPLREGGEHAIAIRAKLVRELVRYRERQSGHVIEGYRRLRRPTTR